MKSEFRILSLPLVAVCLGTLMVSLDRTMVIVALPSIGRELGPAGASQLVSFYLLTSGGFLMIGGRLGDLFGYRNMFVIGATAFLLASLTCALTSLPPVLVAARGVQALGGSVMTVGPTSLVLRLTAEPTRRVQALSLSAATSWIAQSVGPFVGGGMLTRTSHWHLIFLVNIPIGAVLLFVSLASLPNEVTCTAGRRRTLGGALTFAVALLLATGAVTGWAASTVEIRHILALLVGAGLVLLLFIRIESGAITPLIPFELFSNRTIRIASVAGALMGAAIYAAYLVYPSYLQLVRGYDPLKVAFALLPLSLLPAALGFGISAKLVAYLGVREAITVGLSCIVVGLLVLAQAPVSGSAAAYIVPSMLLVGLGMGMAPIPLLLKATGSVPKGQSGFASGAYVTAYTIGSGLGVAVLGGISSIHASNLQAAGASAPIALGHACHLVSGVGALLAATAAAIAVSLPRSN